MKRYLTSLLLIAAVSPLACAAPPAQRGLADVVLRVQQLQSEVQKLRGELEVQKHAIDTLRRRQRELYMDLDSRLSGGGAPATEPAAPPAPSAEPPREPPPIAPAPAPESAPEAPPEVAPEAPPAPIAATAAGDPAQEPEEYQRAFGLLQDGRYTDSIDAFRIFLARYPNGEYADNALYWLGEANYVNRDFTTALGSFSRLLQQHPASPKAPGAMLKIGYIQYEQQSWSQARKMLKQLQTEYPDSTEAQLAGQRLSRMRRDGH